MPRMRAYDRGEPVKGMKGFYRCCMYKWKAQRQKDSWSLICQASPVLAKKWKELPDVIRKFLGKKSKFTHRTVEGQPSTTSIIPQALVDVVAESVVPLQQDVQRSCILYIFLRGKRTCPKITF